MIYPLRMNSLESLSISLISLYIPVQTRSVARPVMFVRPAAFRPLVYPLPFSSVPLCLLPLHFVRPLRLSCYNTPSHRPKHASARHISQERNERNHDKGAFSRRCECRIFEIFAIYRGAKFVRSSSATTGQVNRYSLREKKFVSFNEYVAFSYGTYLYLALLVLYI